MNTIERYSARFPESNQKSLKARKLETEFKSIIDDSVYSYNHNFRILGSAKYEDLGKRQLYLWNAKKKIVHSIVLGSLSSFQRSLVSVTRKGGDSLEWSYIRFISLRSSLHPEGVVTSDKKKTIKFFNDVVAKQWPRPLKFVPENSFKQNASVGKVRIYTGNKGKQYLVPAKIHVSCQK